MTRKATVSFLLAFTAAICVLGCSDSATDSKQPKLVGPPDAKIKGPIKMGGGDVKAAPKQ